ncbi:MULTISPECIES: acyl carrier protein [Lactobacillaceae]|jgi:acyl carrier protein|uniref:Acyl carrier protein n=2 Tax=Lactobacillaceae TaxID=33958 RepID=A0A5P1X7I7_9LACO|nr:MULTISPECIES: acyl carrier protein [Lactobacillaceae]MCW0154569.1 acyl carrier protein [Lactiplantibacillus plantarum]QER68451.1 acyl carrier protein [Paucilactobacillus nenjiangensis]WDF82144.1 acyl carrier protein [Lacticaseibacillus sp. KACC 23028]
MSKEEIIAKIMNVLQQDDSMEGKDITPDMSFKQEMNLDSLDIFELVNEIEDEFEIEIDTDESLDTVNQVADYVQKQLAAKE